MGDAPFARDASGRLKTRIATAFPRHSTLVTIPGVHVSQRQAFVDSLSAQRDREERPRLTRQERDREWEAGVDLIVEEETILIRPDPADMGIAFEADEMLRASIPAERIRFLGVLNERVRDAIMRRGELWRITPLPKSAEEIRALIGSARIGIRGAEIYYYSATTGVRFLTYDQFERMGQWEERALRFQLDEIREYLGRMNAAGFPELAFFPTEARLSRSHFSRLDFAALSKEDLLASWAALRDRFAARVKPELRRDDPDNVEWRNRLAAALLNQEEEVATEQTLLGLSAEFFLQVEWLPGGRIEEGEIVFDPAAETADASDETPRKFIFNFVREYGDLEYINVGRVVASLSYRIAQPGRRAVYIAVLKLQQSSDQMVHILRLQKQGVREYLDQGNSLLDAMVRAEEYTEYILDRRLGCRQLGMNLPLRVSSRRISERYVTREGGAYPIWTPYFEREYIRGTATDKLPRRRFETEEFALACARLLGAAAAPNLIVGRCDALGAPLFDDGDEVLVSDEHGLPVDIVVSDHTGTFNDYASPLTEFTTAYAQPVNRRRGFLKDPKGFAQAYLDGFQTQFLHIQEDYRLRRRAFDSLFSHVPSQEQGSFAYRWKRVLARLDGTEVTEIVSMIRGNILP